MVNPRREPAGVDVPALAGRRAEALEVSGVEVIDGRIETAGFGYGIFALSP